MPRPQPTAGRAGAGLSASLTGRDLEVLQHLDAGGSTAAIAAAMSISTNTVRTRIHRLQDRLGAPVRAEVAPRARSLGLLEGRDRPRGADGAIPPQRGGPHDP
jgi:DNA-binding NarL/FixJ family response regulator